MGAEVPDEQRHLATAMRCIVAAMSMEGTPFNIEGIAEKTGLSPAAVAEALSSEECKRLLEENCLAQTRLALNKGLHVATQIMTGSESEDTRLAAFRSVTTMYRVLTQGMAQHDSGAGEEEVLKILAQAVAPNTKTRRIEVTNENGESGPHHHPDPPEQEDDRRGPGDS
jgi:hypothetical protein